MSGLRTLKAVFLENLGLKMLSLGLAVVLWWVVMGEQKSELIYNTAMEIKNLPPELVVFNNALTEPIQVVLRGTRTDLLSLSPKQIKYALDLKGAKEGERYYALRPENLDPPRGIEVVSITPPRVKLVLEGVGEKLVEVFPQIKGKPAKGYEVIRINTEPDEVRVAGPRSMVNSVRRLETLPVNIEGAKSKVTQEVGFNSGDKKIKILEYKQVEVTVTIVPKEEKNK